MNWSLQMGKSCQQAGADVVKGNVTDCCGSSSEGASNALRHEQQLLMQGNVHAAS